MQSVVAVIMSVYQQSTVISLQENIFSQMFKNLVMTFDVLAR